MTPQQIRIQQTLLDSALRRMWKSRLDPALPTAGSGPQVHVFLENMITILDLEYHAEEAYLLLSINRESGRYLAFRFYFDHRLQELLLDLFQRQDLVNLRNFPGHIEALSKHCPKTFLEVGGLPKYRIDDQPGFLRSVHRNFRVGKPLDQLAEPIKRERFQFQPISQPEEEPDQNALDTRAEATIEVFSRFSREHHRIPKLLAIASKGGEQQSFTLEDPGLIKRNLAQWIHHEKLAFVLLMPTHDSATRSPDKGFAYFDRRTQYPKTEGSYPLDPSEESEALVFAEKNAVGGWVKGTTRIELFNSENRDPEELWEFFRDAISDFLSGQWENWFTNAAQSGRFPVVKNWNGLLSTRIYELMRSICGHPKLRRIPKKEPTFQAALDGLDDLDRQFLADRTRSYLFWDSIKTFNPLAWAECYNRLA